MLRRITILARVLRCRLPGARERLAYRMLHVLVAPEPRLVRARMARSPVVARGGEARRLS